MQTPSNFTEAVSRLDEATDAQAKQWHEQNKKIWLVVVFFWMARGFTGAYFARGELKKGVKGLFTSVNAAMHPFISYAKYWELKRRSK